MAGPILADEDPPPSARPPRIARADALVYALDGSLPPRLRVAADQAFTIETEDSSSGLLRGGELPPTPETTPYARFTPPRANPVGGPVAIEGVKAGGRIEVEIDAIELDEMGVFYSRPAGSPLGDLRSWPDMGEPFSARIDHRDGEASTPSGMRWPLAPMIGTLACAPEWEVPAAALAQGAYGGNLDVKAFAPGAKVQLNAYHDGGLLFAGDVHGCMGDGEYFGVGDESRAAVTLRARPVPGDHLPAPRVETADELIALGIGRPLELAADRATKHLMRWLVDELGFAQRDAALAVGLHPGFHLTVHSMTAIPGLDFVVGASLPTAFAGRA